MNATQLVSGEFTSKTTFDDLSKLRAELSGKNITITYNHIEFNSAKQLKALSFEIEAESLNSTSFGSGKLMDFSSNGKITFKLDFNVNEDPSIEILVKPFGI